MTNVDRFKVYGLGFLLGIVLVSLIMGRRASQEEQVVDPWYEHREQAEASGAEPLPDGVEVSLLKGKVLRFGYLPTAEAPVERVWLLNFRKSYPYVRVVETLADGSIGYMAADQIQITLAEGVDVTDIKPMIDSLGIRLRMFNRKERAAVLGVMHTGIDAVPDTLEAIAPWGELYSKAGPDWIRFQR
ncbi:MAG: hypothetical protein ACON46_07250 [Coraliomargaritaceae bacterium]